MNYHEKGLQRLLHANQKLIDGVRQAVQEAQC